MIDAQTLGAARSYVKQTINELGAVKGANCEIKKTEVIPGGTKITFSWTGKDGTEQTTSIYVMDGVDGKGVYATFVVGTTPFAADWLSLTDGGAPLTPVLNDTYMVVTNGAYMNTIYRWDGIKYAPISGTGTNVEANPAEESTDTLEKLKVGDTVYNVSNGGRPSVDNEQLIFH